MNLSKDIIEKIGYWSGWSQEKIDEETARESLTFKDVLESNEMSDTIKHWVYSMALLSSEDRALYEKYFQLENSEFIYSSQKIRNSYRVLNSDHVYDSQMIKNSHYVTNSYAVENSEGIDNCEGIFNSHDVNDCENLHDSAYCERVRNGYWNQTCIDGDWLISCHNCRNCYFCNNVGVDSQISYNLICCYNFTNFDKDKFYLFNKEIPQEIWEQIKRKLTRELFNKYQWTYISHIPTCGTNKLFNKIDNKDFVKIMKSLPSYDAKLIYNITLVGDFLTN